MEKGKIIATDMKYNTKNAVVKLMPPFRYHTK